MGAYNRYLRPTFIQICRKKSTLGFQSLPYVLSLFSAMLWMFYAFLKTDALLLISVNSIGCVIETIYIVVFLVYASKDTRKQTVKLVAGLNVVLFSAIFLFTMLTEKGNYRIQVVGWICVAISFQVVRTKSVEFMPLGLSFTLTLSAIMWFAYGVLKNDFCIAVPNVLGFILGILQMLLYGMYRSSKGKEVLVIEMEKKVPEHVINVVVMEISPEVYPAPADDDSKMNSTTTVIANENVTVDNEEEEEDEKKRGEEEEEEEEEEKRREENEKSVVSIPAENGEHEPFAQQVEVKLNPPVFIDCAA
ncbi:hypothetical protein LguiB_024577 [Lonicera macranthoides]